MKQEKKKSFKSIILFILFLVACYAFGYVGAKFVGPDLHDINWVPWVISWIVFFMVGAFVHVIVHEAGHLVCGLLSGYKFMSFRIANVMLLNNNGKLQFKRYYIAGTGGQCLMVPPPYRDGKFPYMLYNLGGCIANVLFSLVLLVACRVAPIDLSAIALPMAFVGVLMALINGIPASLGGLPNDGKNAFFLGNKPQALRAFWVQLMTVSQLAKGLRVKDMDEEWFVLPSDDDMGNQIVAAEGVLSFARLVDEQRFDEAQSLAQHLLNKANLSAMHRQLLCCDQITLKLIFQGNDAEVEMLQTPQLEQIMKAMRSYPSVIRTQYVIELLQNGNLQEAEKLHAKFEKTAVRYPYQGEIKSERDLIALAQKSHTDSTD